MVENETNLQMKCLRSNNKEEYIDDYFKQYCVENGIKMTKTILRKPQHNGVAKRMNTTLNERARGIRIHVGFPKMF